MNCDCIKEINRELVKYNTKLDCCIRFDEKKQAKTIDRINISTMKIDSGGKNRTPAPVTAVFCPFCAQKYDNDIIPGLASLTEEGKSLVIASMNTDDLARYKRELAAQ